MDKNRFDPVLPEDEFARTAKAGADHHLENPSPEGKNENAKEKDTDARCKDEQFVGNEENVLP
eukprot:CAMPEP_0178937590 /NCGR_PEP_ID=MMETSP0786-20121207/25849_1 /TAXON_ID=186022 /ORGANISM="Thalassionema frauenfeldii, Strain CCMP 1798" /LENGTH=62 /DNA_ID=CAMNT_0020616193 /DNA_START=144 /DNA_END=328 /DNA_ORIENTATION=-